MRLALLPAIFLLAACEIPGPRPGDSATTAAAATTPVVEAPEPQRVAVYVESPDEGIDTCSGGIVKGDTTLAVRERVEVRAGPNMEHPAVDSLPAGAAFFACDHDRSGAWIGIVYRHDDDPADGTAGCGVSSPVEERRAYAGPCRAGWIPAAQGEIVAG